MSKNHSFRLSPEKFFFLRSGATVKSLRELAFLMEVITDDDFRHHANEQRNDFANWAKDVFGEHRMAKSLENARDRKEAPIAILKHLIR